MQTKKSLREKGGLLRVIADDGDTITAEISVDEWHSWRDHPRQRNTERHAKAEHWDAAASAKGAVLRHLTHVTGAVFADKHYKVDGHTRGLLWMNGQLPRPEKLRVTIYRVKSCDELNELYNAFDIRTAGETAFDKVYGAFRENNLNLKSKRLKHGFLVDALNIALRGASRNNQDKRQQQEVDIYKAVRTFKHELKLLDSVDPQPETFQSGVVAAALIALSLDRECIAFFDRLSKREGFKNSGLMDPVEATLTLVNKLKMQRAAWIKRQQGDLCARTLRAVMAWQEAKGEGREHYWFRQAPRPANVSQLIDDVKTAKRINDDPCL